MLLAGLALAALALVAWPDARGPRLVLFAGDALLALAWVADWLRTPNPERFELERDLPPRARLGLSFERTLRLAPAAGIAGGSPRILRGELSEEFPETCRVVDATGREPESPTGGPQAFRTTPHGGASVTRSYAGLVRGEVRFGDVRVRISSPWGLLWRQGRFAGDQRVAVEPALTGLSRRLNLAASERWRDLGARALRPRGGATEFESLREYVAGDDVRIVDWKAFAKLSRPVVREYQEERGQELLIALDCGRAMTLFGERGPRRGWTKLDSGLDAALQLAAIALRSGDRVGALAFDRETRAWVAPRRGARQLSRLREALFALEPRRVATNLERALCELAVRHRRRATIVLISDVPDPLSVRGLARALGALSKHHQLVFAALDDPDVRATLDDPRADLALRAAASELEEERRQALAVLAASGVRVSRALPAESAGLLISAWLEARRPGSRSRGSRRARPPGRLESPRP